MRTSPQLTSPMKQLLDKLTSRGSASLDDTELLTLLLGEGGEQAAARRLAERLLEYYDGALARLKVWVSAARHALRPPRNWVGASCKRKRPKRRRSSRATT